VEQLGTPEELYDRPATRFVADFIGTTNLLAGRVEAVDGDSAVIRLGSDEVCRIERNGLAIGSPVELSVRPESVSLGELGSTARSALAGRVEQLAFLGTTIEYHVRTTGGLDLVARAPRAGTRYPVGSEVAVGWTPGEALVLASTGPAKEEQS
jgi:spermidine/putrescine transport system ATP-binding protein